MTPECEKKLDRLKEILRKTEGCAVAFSGGVDSTLLLAVASEVLGPRCLAVIATSSTYPQLEFERAVEWVQAQEIPYVTIRSEELSIPGFKENPPDRCYWCKKELFTKVRECADERGLPRIADGSNADDADDYRPGMMAARDLGVLSPLKEAHLTKDDVRTVSREVYHLKTADKPAMACLASRFPYGSAITEQKLTQVEKLEAFLRERGLAVCRARHHGDTVRLELGPDEMASIWEPTTRGAIVAKAKELGFTYVTLDLEGYRTGSMNEVLSDAQRREPKAGV